MSHPQETQWGPTVDRRPPSLRSSGDAGPARLSAELRLREAHHRFSNHIQILTSSLALEALNATPAVREMILTVRGRLLGVARLHQQLESAPDGVTVEAGPFLDRLCTDLILSFGLAPSQLSLECDAGELPADVAVTLSLIVNELVTNAIKHALGPGGTRLSVGLKVCAAGWRLTVADDGPGFGDTPAAEGLGLGFNLLQLLVGGLKGSMRVDDAVTGASISVVFPVVAVPATI